MKLSNKILLGFFGFIFLYLTAVFAEVRLTGTSNVLTDENSIAETVELPGITQLILNDVENEINVVGSDRSSLVVRSIKGDMLKNLDYKISGDTFILANFKSRDRQRIKITVFVSNTNFAGLSAIETAVSVKQVQRDVFQISQDGARIWMNENKISTLKIGMDNRSYLNVSGPKIDTLAVQMDKSEAHFNTPINLLQGVLQNGASLEMNNTQEIQLKKDETSRLSIH